MSRLTEMTWGSNRMHFTYDSLGPASVTYNGNRYFYLKTGGTMAATLGAANPLRYRGYVYDTETGLYYLNSRYYNPVWGRFINADSLIVDCGANTQNLFVYCENNPVRYVDSSGHSAVLAATGIVALAVVLFTGIYCIVTNSEFQQAVRNAIADAYNKAQSFVSGIKETLCASISSSHT